MKRRSSILLSLLFSCFHGDLDPSYSRDMDYDQVPDNLDQCPNNPEDKDAFQDEDGCPDRDNDGDGIIDATDRCTDDPEDKDGFEDSDGCPDRDNDNDSVADVIDKCPNDPEDRDNFEDQDGCPDPDNDGDGVVDSQDACPMIAPPRAYTLDTCFGPPQGPGCPPKIVTCGIVVLDKLFFEKNKASFPSNGEALLDAVAQVMKENPGIEVRVIGHRTPDEKTGISLLRAESARDYLISKGVKAETLTIKDAADNEPLVSQDDLSGKDLKAAQEKNRYLSFEVTKMPD